MSFWKSEGNITWETQSRWEDDVKMDLQEVEFGVMDWIELAGDTDR
jgi:hypothetical protein